MVKKKVESSYIRFIYEIIVVQRAYIFSLTVHKRRSDGLVLAHAINTIQLHQFQIIVTLAEDNTDWILKNKQGQIYLHHGYFVIAIDCTGVKISNPTK